jgi:tripartite-type tricarboxylate transporter receptor subunit TctC
MLMKIESFPESRRRYLKKYLHALVTMTDASSLSAHDAEMGPGLSKPARSTHRGRMKWLLSMAIAISCGAWGQQYDSYPERPVRVVVPFAPGGAIDITARLLADSLSRNLGKQFVVDNRPGAGGTIACGLVAKSRADGYTLLAVGVDFTMTPSLYQNLPYDPNRSFSPVSLVSESPFLLVVHPSLTVSSVSELVALARAKPGALNFASGGQGSSLHIALELFKLLARVDFVHVPYKGGGPALSAAVAGQVHGMFANSVSAVPHVRSGKLRALAVTSVKRSETFPELPSVSESGVRGYEITAWHAWLAPAGTPSAIVTRVSGELAKTVRSADVSSRLAADGGNPIGGSPEQLRRHLAVDLAKYSKVIKAGRIRIE